MPSETDRLLPRPIDTEANKGSNSTFAIQASDVIANDYLHERAKAVQDIEANMTELVLFFAWYLISREVSLNVCLQ